MEEFAFTYKNHGLKEQTTLKIEKEDNTKVTTFHRFCKMAALAFGYNKENIDEVFGETYYFDYD